MRGKVKLFVSLLHQEVGYDFLLRVLWGEDLQVHDFG